MFHDVYTFALMVEVLLSAVWGNKTNHNSIINVHFAKKNVKSPNTRILAGEEVSHEKYSFVVAIMKKDSKTSEEYQSCTGAVVKADLVLTACHCVGDVVGTQVKLFDARLMTVVAGTKDIYEDSPQKQVAKVRAFVAHWNCKFYEPGTIIETDAALMMLKDSLEIGQDVKPLNMVENSPKALGLRLNNQIRLKTVCKLPGYGFSEPDTPTWVLREAELQLISDYECRRIFCEKLPSSEYCNYDYSAKNGFCAIPLSDKDGSTPCRGDSGAPLVCDGYVYGLLTWGSCRPEYPVVLANGGTALELIKMHAKPKYGEVRRSNLGPVQTKQNAVPFMILTSIYIMMM